VRVIGIPVAFMFLLFLIVVMTTPQLLNAVLEEKMSRISEVLLGSVTPFELMLGKLLASTSVSVVMTLVYLTGAAWMAHRWGYLDAVEPRPDGPGAGREQQPVEPDRRPVAEGQRPAGHVEPDGAGTESKLDAGLVVERRGLLHQLLEARLAAEVLLGQRRPLVRRTQLVGHDDQAVGVALGVEGLRGFRGGDAAANDHERAGGAHGICSSSVSAFISASRASRRR
jgi:hypothetical protein